MFIISKILLFLELLLKSAYGTIPIFLLFSFTKTKMFKRSEALFFFLLATTIAIGWRFAYTMLRVDSAIATRYISALHLFLIVLAVPGMYAIVEIGHKLLSRFYKVQRKYIWIILLSATIIASLAKGLKFRETKYFLRHAGKDIEQICRKNRMDKFILFENTGEYTRLAYYAPFLNNRTITPARREFHKPFIDKIIKYIKKDYKKWDKVFVFTREKSKNEGITLKDWNLVAQKKLNIKEAPFSLIKKYPHRKYYYYIFEFNLNCLRKK